MPPTQTPLLTAAAAQATRIGFSGLRPLQIETLAALARRESVLACLPTGYGKSACYLLPAAAWGWRAWVVSPLLSLIQDQHQACATLGIPSLAFLPGTDRRQLHKELEDGRWRVCLLSPERFCQWQESGYLRALAGMGLDADLVVLDEMHCLEDWRGFRSGYTSLAHPVRECVARGALVLGLSASLPEADGRAWMEELCGAYTLVRSGLGRENLRLQVLALEEEAERWVALVSALRDLREPRCALVYCARRVEADDVARWLRSAGWPAVAYHAGLPGEERRERARAFRAGRLRVVCATVAFGMGVDYAHVDRVIHFSMPRDLESYWQEVGRAGRGGAEAHGIALWRRSEIVRARVMRLGERQRFAALWDAWARALCRRRAVAARLGVVEEDCGNCDHCLGGDGVSSPLGRWDRSAWWAQDRGRLREWVAEKFRDYSRERGGRR